MMHETPVSVEYDPLLTLRSERSAFQVYTRRWYVLFAFTLVSIVSNMMWNTWGPIQGPCKIVFGWEDWQILLLSSWGASGPMLGSFISTWLMDTKGMITRHSTENANLKFICTVVRVNSRVNALTAAYL